MSEPGPENRDKRSGVIIRALLDVNGVHLERRVRNLSQHGACVDNQGDLEQGATVRVTMGSLENMLAQVVWAKPQLAGLHFRQAVDLEAARTPRRAAATPQAGWMADMNHAYRRKA